MRHVAARLVLTLVACSGSTEAPSVTTSGPDAPGWVELAPMEVARSEHPGVALDAEIVVMGGFVEAGLGSSGVAASVEAYSPGDDAWRRLPDLAEPRHHGMAAVVGDRLYFIGGYSTAGEPTSTVWELADDRWVERARAPAMWQRGPSPCSRARSTSWAEFLTPPSAAMT